MQKSPSHFATPPLSSAAFRDGDVAERVAEGRHQWCCRALLLAHYPWESHGRTRWKLLELVSLAWMGEEKHRIFFSFLRAEKHRIGKGRESGRTQAAWIGEKFRKGEELRFANWRGSGGLRGIGQARAVAPPPPHRGRGCLGPFLLSPAPFPSFSLTPFLSFPGPGRAEIPPPPAAIRRPHLLPLRFPPL